MVKLKGKASPSVRFLRGMVPGIVTALAWLGLSAAAVAAGPAQMTFASPEDASDALVAAVQSGKTADLEKILGPASRNLIYSGDAVADQEGRETFTSEYAQKHTIDRQSDDRALLVIGTEEWPFPIPLVKQGDRWRLDTKAGADEILNRRIGRNELNAIQVSRAVVDAERDYASKDRNGDGYLEYTQKFMSSPGKRDGLYWPADAGEESPIGPLIVSARAEGYDEKDALQKRSPYHGYFYKLLAQQGKDAAGGAYHYIVNGHMIGGFGLVAFPAEYGDSGVMTFIVNQDGVVFEKNLGPKTIAIARKMTTFNPDSSWTPHQ